MRKFIIKILVAMLLLPIFWAVGLVFVYEFLPSSLRKNIVFYSNPSDDMNFRLMDADSTKKMDVVIFGSSHAYRGFDNRLFEKEGIEMFNFGSSSQTPIQSVILDDSYRNQMNPQLAIIEVYPNTYSLDGVESMLKMLPKINISAKSIESCITINHPKVYNHLILRIYKSLFKKEKPVEMGENSADTYVKGGFVETRKTGVNELEEIASEHFEIIEYQMETLEALITELQNKEIEVALVFAPISKTSYLSIENIKEFDDYFKNFENVSYYDFNPILNLPDSMFYDHDHLTQNGVELFNASVFEIVIELEGFKN